MQEFSEIQVMSLDDFSEIFSKKQIASSKKTKANKTKIDKIAQTKGESNLVQKEEASQTEAKGESAASFNSYVNAIASELDRRKSRFSMAMAPEDVKTHVVFKIKIDERGNLVRYKMEKDSGYGFFDKIAQKILTYKGSFPPPPKELLSSDLEFNIPIIFDSLR